jgi:asparagine synthase (glutamine-hydrolysing)
MIWDDASALETTRVDTICRQLADASPQWREALRGPGLRVLCADAQSSQIHRLAHGAGVILGALFERVEDPEDDTPARRASFTQEESSAIVNSGGRRLIERYWGNYVAFLAQQRNGCPWIVKDPTGNLPCFLTTSHGLILVFSCMADCVALNLRRFTLDRRCLEARLTMQSEPLVRDPIEGVARIYGGERIAVDPRTHGDAVRREFLWTPLDFDKADEPIDHPDRAAAAMRMTIRSCTHAMTSDHERLLMRLSGGLDSSIVVGCLKLAPTRPDITCYTYFTPDARSIELPWAQLVAREAGMKHLECAVYPQDLDLARLQATMPTVEPPMGLIHILKTTLEAELVGRLHATGVFSGDGGDAVFGSHSMAHAVADYLRHRGLRPGAVRFASQLALNRELSTTALLLRSLREWLFGARSDDTPEETLKACVLLSEDLRRNIGSMQTRRHPWFSRSRNVYGGLVDRLGVLSYVSEYYFGADQQAPAPQELAPLYAQPVVETLLRVPLHLLCEGGRDRGLARRAFAGDAPRPVLDRLWKDRAPGFHYELLQRNRAFLRELLLDGVLVREGFLNRRAVENALSGDPTKARVYPGEILAHVDTEIWARRWIEGERRRQAA